MAKTTYYQQNNGHLAPDPPKYFGRFAKECYRRVVPFLESTGRVERIDSSLVERYCISWEQYREAYEGLLEDGLQTKHERPVQNSAGEIIAWEFVGYIRNPLQNTMKDANVQLDKIGSELGLSPKAREKLMQLANTTKKEKSTKELAKEAGLI